VLEDLVGRCSRRLAEAGGLLAAECLPVWVLCDDPEFAAASLENFLWVTFTRSDPARDVHGIESFTQEKLWGCRGPLVIDARLKPHHAPVLEADPEVARKVDRLFAAGGSLAGLG
jgi:4-hydroxy-3-polyprenylbenzoate decarboxylase